MRLVSEDKSRALKLEHCTDNRKAVLFENDLSKKNKLFSFCFSFSFCCGVVSTKCRELHKKIRKSNPFAFGVNV